MLREQSREMLEREQTRRARQLPNQHISDMAPVHQLRQKRYSISQSWDNAMTRKYFRVTYLLLLERLLSNI